MNKLKILLWGINENKEFVENMCYNSVNSAKKYNITIEYLGLGIKFKEHKQRLNILKNYLPSLDPDTIVLCMDGSDTLFNSDSNLLLSKFMDKQTKIVISAEKNFTYQYSYYKDRFDSILSPYKYVNAGTFMGYAKNILEMINDMIEIDKKQSANDQGLLGIWVYKNIDNIDLVKMDLNCDIFWVTTSDWKTIMNKSFSDNRVIINPFTKTRPCIIHYTGKGDNFLVKGYNKLYKLILQ
jgi:hypothetical protein